MTPLATFLTACLLLCAVHGKTAKKKKTDCKRGSVTEVLAALQKETYYLTGTTNTTREPCYFLSTQGLNQECVSGTPVTYGYKESKKWVNVTEGVAEQKDEKVQAFPSNLRGPLSGKRVLVQGNNCFVLRLNKEIELWVTKAFVDTSTCCKSKFDNITKGKTSQTTYEPDFC
uniref:Putative salivary lipocalin n=1 Tax=Ornithodoros turicata TaxID=34597 RepID=A0A2R5L912_9ACAR